MNDANNRFAITLHEIAKIEGSKNIKKTCIKFLIFKFTGQWSWLLNMCDNKKELWQVKFTPVRP